MLRTRRRRRPRGRRKGWIDRDGDEWRREKFGIKFEIKFESRREELRHMILYKKTGIKEFEGIRMVVMNNQINNQLNNQTNCDGWVFK